jgi:hypothetical protein
MTSLSKKKPAVVAKTARKRGRPVGSKNKPATKVKPAAKAKEFKRSEFDKLLDDLFDAEVLCLKMHQTVESLELKVKNLEHKAMQYEVVIDYLETKLEIK